MRPSDPPKRTTAAEMPSSDVPDIKPTNVPPELLIGNRRRGSGNHAPDHAIVLRK